MTWALKQLIVKPECYGRVFNIGSNEETSVLDLAHKIKAQLGSESEIVFVPYEQVYGPGFEETIDRAPDTRRVREAIGFDPQTTLAEMIDLVAKLQTAEHA